MNDDPDTLLARVLRLVCDVLSVPHDAIDIETEGADVEAWDSFGHVRIVLALEAELGIQLTMEDIERSGSIRGLLDVAEAALARRGREAPDTKGP